MNENNIVELNKYRIHDAEKRYVSASDEAGKVFHIREDLRTSSFKESDSAIATYQSLSQMHKCLQRIEEQNSIHHTITDDNHKELLSELSKLKEENNYFRNELSLKNTPQQLKKYSSATIMFCFLDVLLNFFSGVTLLHPAMLVTVFSVSFVFLLMSYVMEKQDSKNDS